MLLLKPVSKERIWGTERLKKFSGDPSMGKIGSVYTVCANKDLSNIIMNGAYKGEELYSIVNMHPELFGLHKGDEFPMVVSITGADDNLSVQVHPDDKRASESGLGRCGKTESWWFIEKPSEGWIYADTSTNDKALIKNEILNGDFEKIVNKLPVEQWDLVHIPSGTLHALTKGAVVCEIQQALDVTYRLYDYDRRDDKGNPRELHLEDGLKALNTSQKAKKINFKEDVKQCFKEYNIKNMRLNGSYSNSGKLFQTITLINGDIKVNGENVKQGMSFIVLPGETVDLAGSAICIIAEPNAYLKK